MFYSHQILARKGPLATVWMAAHLHHRLKKPHYNSVDINSTVEHIMFPEAPIALRMSGHLLLGVVRIYSKKVDYLHKDCNEIMVKVSTTCAAPPEGKLTDTAANAPRDDVTLPERFELDALNLDNYELNQQDTDKYIRSTEDITLPDPTPPTPLNMDHYVAITFEDMEMATPGTDVWGLGGERERILTQPGIGDRTESSGGAGPELASESFHDASDSGVQPMEEDVYAVPGVIAQGPQDPGPSNQSEAAVEETPRQHSPQSIEVMRHAVFGSSLPGPPMPNQGSVETEHQKAHLSNKENEFISPAGGEFLESGEQPPSVQLPTQRMASALSDESPNLRGPHLSFGLGSVDLAIRSTPVIPEGDRPPSEEGPRIDGPPDGGPPNEVARRQRKRLLQPIVLSNKRLKAQLEDTSNILRKKRRLPDTLYGSQALEQMTMKEQIIFKPLIGISENLYDVCKDLSTRPHLANPEEPLQEARNDQTPDVVPGPVTISGIPVPQFEFEPVTEDTNMETEPITEDMNIETEPQGDALTSTEVQVSPHALDREPEQSLRNATDSGNVLGGKHAESPPSPTEADLEIERLRGPEGHIGTSLIPEFAHTTVVNSPLREDDFPEFSGGSFRSGHEGESTFRAESWPTPPGFASEEIPELMKSAEAEELQFLEVDNSSSGFGRTPDAHSMSVRTRAVAQYLKGFSPANPTEQSPDISLNDILKGKPRKICARMFYETLVLKSCDLIDVKQNESYGDITLKVTPALKEQL